MPIDEFILRLIIEATEDAIGLHGNIELSDDLRDTLLYLGETKRAYLVWQRKQDYWTLSQPVVQA